MDNPLRDRMWSLLTIVLRIPPLFIMDAIMNTEFGLNSSSENLESHTLTEDSDISDSRFGLFSFVSLLWFILYLIAFLLSFGAFLLRTQHLLHVYVVISSLGVILWSYIWNQEYVKYTFELAEVESNLVFEIISIDRRAITQTVANYFVQLFLSLVFSFGSSYYSARPPSFSHPPGGGATVLLAANNIVITSEDGVILNNNDNSLANNNGVGRGSLAGGGKQHQSPWRIVFTWTIFIGPMLACFAAPLLPSKVVSYAPLFAASCAHGFLVAGVLSNRDALARFARESWLWARTVLTHYGLPSLLSMHWNRLQVPQVLRIFWLIRVTEHATHLLSSGQLADSNVTAVAGQLLSKGCETLVAVVGMTSIVSSVSHFIACAARDFLQAEDTEERSVGTVSALLFLVLALQTGLTQMDPQKRLSRLYRNFCLLGAAVLHFVHAMLNSTLVLLSASQNVATHRHVRALILSGALLVLPCMFLVYLWSHHTLSTWLLAVTAFSTEVIIKVIISLIVYLLFIMDARYTGDIWEGLDDYVFYVRATGSFIEFIFGVFLLLNGTWIFFFEAGGTIRAMMMCFHAYFNIWQQAQNGWETCMRRRNAAAKLATLQEATPEQLAVLDDVCAICHQNMQSAKITRCNHYYHRVCIRKWLYLQDLCPICSRNMWLPATGESEQQAATDRSPPVFAPNQEFVQPPVDAATVSSPAPVAGVSPRRGGGDADEGGVGTSRGYLRHRSQSRHSPAGASRFLEEDERGEESLVVEQELDYENVSGVQHLRSAAHNQIYLRYRDRETERL